MLIKEKILEDKYNTLTIGRVIRLNKIDRQPTTKKKRIINSNIPLNFGGAEDAITGSSYSSGHVGSEQQKTRQVILSKVPLQIVNNLLDNAS